MKTPCCNGNCYQGRACPAREPASEKLLGVLLAIVIGVGLALMLFLGAAA